MNPPPQFGIPPAMQVVSRHRNRRKGPGTITKRSEDHVWQRTLNALGLETLHSQTNFSTSTTTLNAMDAPVPTPTTALVPKVSIPDLPIEVQRNIFKHASSPDLIALSLVSRHFRRMAAEEIYRTFHIVFPDEDDYSNDSSIDGLAGGLDTFVTSEYDYAQHLRGIILETLSGGEKGERTYKDYLYSVSCGKFMNTLLLLTLRKAKALETFKWDIRVELSRQVFKALHQIGSLENLHLRMQAGSSLYQAPPAIGGPPPPAPSGLLTVSQITPPPPPPPAHHNGPIPILPPGMPTPSSNAYAIGYKMAQKAHQKQMKASLPGFDAPPTLADFKNLKTLSILDIDTHEYTEGLKACIEASPNLKSLRLSFSESFANKSRRPPPEVHSDEDSDQEDEFGQIIQPPGTIDPSAPTQALKAQEQKKKQEAMLAIILGWEPPASKIKLVTPLRTTAAVEKEIKAAEEPKDPKDQFIKRLVPWAKRIMINAQPGSGQSDEGKELLEIIENACKVYLESTGKSKQSSTLNAGSTITKGTPASSATSGDDLTPSGSTTTDEVGLFDEPKKKKKTSSDESGVSNPEDIDIDEPEDEIEFDTGDEPTAAPSPTKTELPVVEDLDAAANKPMKSTPTAELISTWDQLEAMSLSIKRPDVLDSYNALAENYEDFKHIEETLKLNMDRLNAEQESGPPDAKTTADLALLNAEWIAIREKLDQVSRMLGTVKESLKKSEAASPNLVVSKSGMNEYLRKTRGLALSTLEIYLIPVKSTVLSQTIDLHSLQSITLLNVGHQNQLWNVMMAKNNLLPLPLHKIYTDNVTLSFLVFASQLDQLTELIMVERAPKQKVESTADKTIVTIEQIRKFVLKKHAITLKVLVIKNKSTADWDIDVKTAMLLCRRAKKLEELACIYGSKVLHSLLQFMPGMESLRALHCYQFRDGDNCLWVTEGSRKFTVDMLAHNPEMKLEYIALDNSVDRIVRRKPEPKSESSTKAKGKAKVEPNYMLSELTASAIGGINSVPTWEAAIASGNADWESSDEEDDDGSFAKGLKLETVEGCLFWNIPGVRIFEKDVLTGAL